MQKSQITHFVAVYNFITYQKRDAECKIKHTTKKLQNFLRFFIKSCLKMVVFAAQQLWPVKTNPKPLMTVKWFLIVSCACEREMHKVNKHPASELVRGSELHSQLVN